MLILNHHANRSLTKELIEARAPSRANKKQGKSKKRGGPGSKYLRESA